MQVTYTRPEQAFPPIAKLGHVMEKLTSGIFGLGEEYIEFKHVLEKFPNPILITTADSRIIFVNTAWEKLTGYTFDEVLGKNPSFLKSERTAPKVFKLMWGKLQSGESFKTEDIINTHKSGTEYQISSTIFPIIEDGKPLFYVQIEEDITNRKKLEDLKREFLSTATHELKTPITTLKLMLQSQLRKIKDKEFTKINIQELDLIDRELNRLTYIIDDLSDISRIESGKLVMNMKVADISLLISDVVRQMSTIAERHPLSILNKTSIEVIADENRIKQVLINLIKNAIKYSYPETEITIATKIVHNTCIVSVQNRGPGIPETKVPHIFDRFYQAHKTNSGMGLGLYVAKKIIEQHKGKMWVKSHEHTFTTFYFSLSMHTSFAKKCA
jgi:PAS domain S-box-containing protein